MSRFKKILGREKPREKQEILSQYTQLCSFIGDRKFKINTLEKEIVTILAQMETLSKEMDKVHAKEKSDQVAAQAKPEATT